MIKFNGSISFLAKKACKICGRTYEGDSNVVIRKMIVHLIFCHPKESLKAIIEGHKRRKQQR